VTGFTQTTQDGGLIISIPGWATTIAFCAIVLYIAYAVLTSRRVGVTVPWRRLGYCLAAAAVAAGGFVAFAWHEHAAKITAGALHAHMSVRHELAYAAGSLAVMGGLALFVVVTMTARRGSRRRPGLSRRRRRPSGDMPLSAPFVPPGPFGPGGYRDGSGWHG
jgi:putative copper export protein